MTHLPDTAAATRPEPPEVTQQRIGVLDVARGIAIIGTLATNIWIFTDPGGIVGYGPVDHEVSVPLDHDSREPAGKELTEVVDLDQQAASGTKHPVRLRLDLLVGR
jgi:hypothetical protein